MGLSVVSETEQSESLGEVRDPRKLLHQFLPSYEDGTYQCLRFVDRYGDAVFNGLQMDTVLESRAGATQQRKPKRDEVPRLRPRILRGGVR